MLIIIFSQHFSIEGEYRKLWIIYRRSNVSKHIIGYIINDKLFWLSQFEIEMSRNHPNYLLWTSLTRLWDWILGILYSSWFLDILQRNKKDPTYLCQQIIIHKLFFEYNLRNLIVWIYLAFQLMKWPVCFILLYFLLIKLHQTALQRIDTT